jgi:hypothetical protein
MGADLIYPIVNLFQYSLREALDDSEDKKLKKAKTFYGNFFDNLNDTELQKYRDREQADLEFNDKLIDPNQRAIREPLDGSRDAIQLGDTYALHLNFSGQLDSHGKTDTSPQNPDTAFDKLIEFAKLEKLFPTNDGCFGRTWLLIAFVENPQADKLEIAKNNQIDLKSLLARTATIVDFNRFGRF